ncbi:hypothetical protein DFH08DRAFT_686508, partial [Mycena albidolilacea]
FDLGMAKLIILHLLRLCGSAYMHSRGLVHTDLRPKSIFFSTEMQATDMERWMKDDPSRRYPPGIPPVMSQHGVVQAAVSQPLPLISDETAHHATYVITDFSSTMPSKLHDDRQISARIMRAPEAYLWWAVHASGHMVVWMSGSLRIVHDMDCLKFDEDENVLYQMLLYTGESTFRAAKLSVCSSSPSRPNI